MVGLSSSVFALVFNLYLLTLAHQPDFIGLLAGIPPLVTALLCLPSGWLGDRIGHRRTLLISTFLMTAWTLGVAFFSQSAILVFCMTLAGLSGALWSVISAPFMLEQSNESERTYLFSAQFAISTFAGFFGSLLGGALPSFFAALFSLAPDSPRIYQLVLGVSVLLGFLSFLPLLWIPKPQSEIGQERPSVRTRTPFRTIFMLAFPNVLMGLGAGFIIPFLNIFFKLEFGASDALIGALFAGLSIAMGIASLASAPLASKFGKVRTIVWTQGLSLPFLLLLGFVPVFELSVLGFLVRGALMPMAAPIYNLFIMEQVAPEDRATVNAWATMTWNWCYALTSWVSGLVQKSWGFDPVFLATGICYVGCVWVQQVLFTPREARPPARPTQ
jgi:MFS family permease